MVCCGWPASASFLNGASLRRFWTGLVLRLRGLWPLGVLTLRFIDGYAPMGCSFKPFIFPCRRVPLWAWTLLVALPLWAPPPCLRRYGTGSSAWIYRATLGLLEWHILWLLSCWEVLCLSNLIGFLPSSYRWLPPLELWWTGFESLDLGSDVLVQRLLVILLLFGGRVGWIFYYLLEVGSEL